MLDTVVEEEIFTKLIGNFVQSRAIDSGMMLNMTEQNTQLGQQLSEAMNMMSQMQENPNLTATGFEVTKISATTSTINMEAIRTPSTSSVEGNRDVPATVEEAEDKIRTM